MEAEGGGEAEGQTSGRYATPCSATHSAAVNIILSGVSESEALVSCYKITLTFAKE